MKLGSVDGKLGRIEADTFVTFDGTIEDWLAGRHLSDSGARPLRGARLGPPVPRPQKIIAVGLNYRDHARETGTKVPTEPPLFAKYSNSLIGDGDVIHVPPETQQPDWEAELGVVIGKTAQRVKASEALHYVAGYMCLNDVSARDLQTGNMQWMRGKAIDSFLPSGPFLLSADQVSDPQTLSIRCEVNGEVVQDSNTSEMIWSVAELIAFISLTCTLVPGDLIATGTPSGVGAARNPKRWLQDGDQVAVEIERLGQLTNLVSRP